jgi:hypothetical protein
MFPVVGLPTSLIRSHGIHVVETDEMGHWNSNVSGVVVVMTIWGLDSQIRDDTCRIKCRNRDDTYGVRKVTSCETTFEGVCFLSFSIKI